MPVSDLPLNKRDRFYLKAGLVLVLWLAFASSLFGGVWYFTSRFWW
jgi:hypothetical protein